MYDMEKIETETGYNILLDDFKKLKKTEKDEFLMEFVYQSNLIEGINRYWIETISEGDPPNPMPELTDHFKALEYVMKNYSDRDPNQDDIKKVHGLMMDEFLEDAGNYRETKMYIGGKGCPYYRYIPQLMDTLDKKIEEIDKKSSLDDIWNIHHLFETIHPFRDGNGRTGRLLLNWLSLKYNKEFVINTLTKRPNYYESIRCYTKKFKEQNPHIKFYKDIKLIPRAIIDIPAILQALDNAEIKE
jgi:Fic family protein